MISDSPVLKEAQGVRAKNYRGASSVAKTDDVWQRPHLLGGGTRLNRRSPSDSVANSEDKWPGDAIQRLPAPSPKARLDEIAARHGHGDASDWTKSHNHPLC